MRTSLDVVVTGVVGEPADPALVFSRAAGGGGLVHLGSGHQRPTRHVARLNIAAADADLSHMMHVRRPCPGPAGRAATILLGGFAVLAVWLLGGWGGPAGIQAVTDLGQLLAALAATWAAAATWRRCSGRRRHAWGALTVAIAAWAVGELAWCYYELLASRATPFPSLADAGFLLFPPAAMLGLWWYPSGAGGRTRARLLLDAATVATSLLLISWVTVLGAVYHVGGSSPFAFGVSLAYPLGDLALLTVAALVLSRGASRRRLPLVLLGAGMAAMAVSDSAFTYLTATERYSSGGLTDLGWPAAFVLLALAALSERDDSTENAETDVVVAALSRTAVFLPYAALLLAAGIGAGRLLTGHGVDQFEQGNLAALAVLVFLRQLITLTENTQLIRAVALREQQLHYQAFHDPLTGLANRALFANRLAHAVELHRRDARPLSVLLLDLDDFKVINDTLGHPAGDELLVRVAERLRGCLRSADTVARLGGDEFAVLLEAGFEPPEAVAARVVTAFSQPFTLTAGEAWVTSSIGLAADSPETVELSSEEIMRDVDVAMYAAKRGGKGHFAVFDSAMRNMERDDITLRDDLVGALAEGQLEVAYEPIRYLDTGQLWGLEAVARWRHPGLGVLAAERFLPLAEKSGLLPAIDDWVVEQACGQLARWRRTSPDELLRLAVNVSGSILSDIDYPGRVTGTLLRHGVPAEQLVIEIAEGTLMTDAPAALAVTAALRRLGVQLAIDHFGTGPSSLAYLDRFPIGYAKIDPSFTQRATSAGGTAVLRALAEMCTALDVTPICQGIRNAEEDAAVRAAGLLLGQGHYCGTPVSPAASPITAEALPV
ncbi:MAG: bifunctional diguanylate cyclase/phosphodiesterase [Frankiaceae bacterium]